MITQKQIKFITTFSKNGYYVYGKFWIESFLEFTKNYPDITAKVYIDNIDIDSLDFNEKVDIVDFDVAIPQHKNWVELFKKESNQSQHNKDLAIKFSFKSFVMINELKNNDDCYVIWLDADSIFKSYDFNNFPDNVIGSNFIACQKESGSEHCESGVVIFDASHKEKQKFIDKFESFYLNSSEFNSFGQFFDGYAIWRTLDHTKVSCSDLNEGFGYGGIQSDPTRTFMNPELRKRFYHNIGITGKRNYQNWKDFATIDPFFQLIHGVNDKSSKELKKENLSTIKSKLGRLTKKRK